MEDNRSNKKKAPALIAVIVVIVVIAAAVGYSVWSSSNKKAESETEVSTVNVTEAQTELITEPTTEPAAERTTSKTTEATTNLKPGEIKNIKAKCYDVSDPAGGGFIGIMISFDGVKNADGYRIKYIYEYGEKPEENYQDIDSSHTKLYYGSQQGPTKIEACAYNKSDSGTVCGAWSTIYDGSDFDFSALDNLDGNKWDSMVKGYYEIDPFYNYNY